MTDTELWQAIHEHNRRQKIRERKLTDIHALLPPPDRILTIKEFLVLLNHIRKIIDQNPG